MGTEFDTENLLRMDSITLVTTIRDAVGAGVMSPNEGRAKLDLKPVKGGKSPYLQQQNYQPRGAGQARRAGRSVQAGNATSTAATAGRGRRGAQPDKPKPDPQKLAAMFTMELREARARHAAAA